MVAEVGAALKGANKLPQQQGAALFNAHQHELIEAAQAHAELLQWEAFTEALGKVTDPGTQQGPDLAARPLRPVPDREEPVLVPHERPAVDAARPRPWATYINRLLVQDPPARPGPGGRLRLRAGAPPRGDRHRRREGPPGRGPGLLPQAARQRPGARWTRRSCWPARPHGSHGATDAMAPAAAPDPAEVRRRRRPLSRGGAVVVCSFGCRLVRSPGGAPSGRPRGWSP